METLEKGMYLIILLDLSGFLQLCENIVMFRELIKKWRIYARKYGWEAL
jgi:hypothetical protein